MRRNIKYFIDSFGFVHEEAGYFEIELRHPNTRASELSGIVSNVTSSLGWNDDKAKSFDYVIDMTSGREGIFFFALEQISASDERVKKANLSGYQCNSLEEKRLLGSIRPAVIKGHTYWYIVRAEFVWLERNIYDNKYISLSHEEMTYAGFLKYFNEKRTDDKDKKELLKEGIKPTGDEHLTFLCIEKKSYDDFDKLLPYAFMKDNAQISDFHKACDMIRGACLIDEKDVFSNEKTLYLMRCIDRVDKIFPVYEDVKKTMKKEEGMMFVNYKRNMIQFRAFGTDDEKLYRLFVSGNTAAPVFLINGNTYFSLDSFKQALHSRECLKRTEWFGDIERPLGTYIENCFSYNHRFTKSEERKFYGCE